MTEPIKPSVEPIKSATLANPTGFANISIPTFSGQNPYTISDSASGTIRLTLGDVTAAIDKLIAQSTAASQATVKDQPNAGDTGHYYYRIKIGGVPSGTTPPPPAGSPTTFSAAPYTPIFAGTFSSPITPGNTIRVSNNTTIPGFNLPGNSTSGSGTNTVIPNTTSSPVSVAPATFSIQPTQNASVPTSTPSPSPLPQPTPVPSLAVSNNINFSTFNGQNAGSTPSVLGQLGVTSGDTTKAIDQLVSSAAPTGNAAIDAVPPVAEVLLDSLSGDMLQINNPHLRLSTYQHSTLVLAVNDPTGTIREKIGPLQNIEIEIGFVNGYKVNKFMGKILTLGRRMPGATIIKAVDNAYGMQETTAAATPTSNASQPVVAPTITNQTQTSTQFQGHAGIGATAKTGNTSDGKPYDPTTMTGSHATLPYGTQVKVTNPANGKTAVIVINDHKVSSGQVLTVTPSVATALSLAQNGTINAATIVPPTSTSTGTTTSGVTTNTPPTNAPPPTTGVASAAPVSVQSTQTLENLSFAVTADQAGKQSLAEIFTKGTPHLKFMDRNPVKLEKMGAVQLQQSKIGAAAMEQALQGGVIAVSGNTVATVAPGQGMATSVVLDYIQNRAAFVGHPSIEKRTNVHLQNSGAVTVSGFDINNKAPVGATVVTPEVAVPHSTGVIASSWGQVKLTDPIIPGSPYTWGDATKQGSRVPSTPEIMQGIVNIATEITAMTLSTLGPGQKWQIISWLQNPKDNIRDAINGMAGLHMNGSAVDIYFPGYKSLYAKLDPTWPAGLALSDGKSGNFMHIDLINKGTRRRWKY